MFVGVEWHSIMLIMECSIYIFLGHNSQTNRLMQFFTELSAFSQLLFQNLLIEINSSRHISVVFVPCEAPFLHQGVRYRLYIRNFISLPHLPSHCGQFLIGCVIVWYASKMLEGACKLKYLWSSIKQASLV